MATLEMLYASYSSLEAHHGNVRLPAWLALFRAEAQHATLEARLLEHCRHHGLRQDCVGQPADRDAARHELALDHRGSCFLGASMGVHALGLVVGGPHLRASRDHLVEAWRGRQARWRWHRLEGLFALLRCEGLQARRWRHRPRKRCRWPRGWLHWPRSGATKASLPPCAGRPVGAVPELRAIDRKLLLHSAAGNDPSRLCTTTARPWLRHDGFDGLAEHPLLGLGEEQV
mmetsp:Transcript_105281/g.280310  ORF Transcript_105281/g.280310 Transcript_105281/m.280310 type:complete len:230 (-) Transcript_105281:72-761(-)